MTAQRPGPELSSPIHVLVTGAATGIGRAICSRLLADGAEVTGVGLDADAGQKLAEEWRGEGLPFAFHPVDVTDEASLVAVTGRLGGLGGLVISAGIYPAPVRVHELSVADWHAVIGANLTGAFLTCRAVLPLLMRMGGAIVTIASVHAISAAPGQAAYSASKAGLVGLTRQLAVDYAADGIRANSILAGSVDTRITRAAIAEVGIADGLGLAHDRRALGRIADADEIAGIVAFLLSSQASFMTGAALLADGGLTSRIL